MGDLNGGKRPALSPITGEEAVLLYEVNFIRNRYKKGALGYKPLDSRMLDTLL